MKAVFLVGARRLELRDVPEPAPPVGGLVLRVEACGVCGSDLRRWKEGPPEGRGGLIPGHEIGGVVTEAGPGLMEYAEGDRLAVAPDIHCGRCYYCQRGMYNLCDDVRLVGITPGCPGGLAERMTLTRALLVNGIVHRIPDGVSFVEGALAEPCSSVLASHRRLGTGLGDTVVVIGAGPIGCLHVAVAKARGARAIISEPSATRRELAERFQPDAIIDPSTQDVVASVRQLTAGRGADIAICANPVADTQRQAVELVRKGGKVVLFGGLPRANPMTSLDGNLIHYGELEVIGAYSYHPTMHELALAVLARKIIRAEDIVTHSFPLDTAQEAFETAASGQGLKVMIAPGSC